MDKCMKYSHFKIYLYHFWELTYRSDPSMDFCTWWLKWHRHMQGCAFWGYHWYYHHLVGQINQNPKFWGHE